MALVTSVDVNPILNIDHGWRFFKLCYHRGTVHTDVFTVFTTLCTLDIAIIVTNLFNMCKKKENCYEITARRSLELLEKPITYYYVRLFLTHLCNACNIGSAIPCVFKQ